MISKKKINKLCFNLKLPKLNITNTTDKKTITNYFYSEKILHIKLSKLEKHIIYTFNNNPDVDQYKLQNGLLFFNQSINKILGFNINNEPVFNDQCPICLENIQKNKEITISCSHSYCMSCFTKLLQNNNKCALCRSIIDIYRIKFNVNNKKFMGGKIKFLIQMLMFLKDKCNTSTSDKQSIYIVSNYDWEKDFNNCFDQLQLKFKNIKFISPLKNLKFIDKLDIKGIYIQYTFKLNNFEKKYRIKIREFSQKYKHYKILK